MNCCHGILPIQRDRIFQANSISKAYGLSNSHHIVGPSLPMTRVHLMNLPDTILGFAIAEEKILMESEVARRVTFAVRIAPEITTRLTVRRSQKLPMSGNDR